MSCANTSWPEYMMENHREKTPVSQKIHVQVGDTPKHIISYSRSNRYMDVQAKLPDTTVKNYKINHRLINKKDNRRNAYAQKVWTKLHKFLFGGGVQNPESYRGRVKDLNPMIQEFLDQGYRNMAAEK